jgi:hypothetical protein
MKKVLLLLIVLANFMFSDAKAQSQYYGYWLNTKYLESLRETKSTKKSQNVDPLSILYIYEEYGQPWVMRIWGFHEGSGANTLFLSESKGVVKYENRVIYDIDFYSPDTLRLIDSIGSQTFVKYYDDGTEPHTLINQTLFAGKYLLNGEPIELTELGEITGIDSLTHYRVNIDYNDAGMQFDIMYLTLRYFGNEVTLGYEFRGNTLEIFNLICKEYDDEEGEYCLIRAKGPTVYKLVRK